MSEEDIVEEMKFPEDYYQYDSEDMKSAIQGFANQVKLAYAIPVDVRFEGDINKIIICGLGGSAIAGDILKTYLKDEKIPITVSREYELSRNADKKTLVIISSYSGNTEETVSSYRDALRKGCKVISVTSGGKISEMSITHRTQVIKIPRGMQPRAALAYSFFPMLKILETLKVIESRKQEVDKLVTTLDKKLFMETGAKLSGNLVGKIPLIYSSEMLAPVAYRWKTQINENAKAMAFNNVFPELNHNELSALVNLNANFHCIMIRTNSDPHRVVKRMEITKKIYMQRGIDVTDMLIKGDTYLAKLFSAVHIGDWTSYYLGLRYKIDPTPVDEIEGFKKALGSYI